MQPRQPSQRRSVLVAEDNSALCQAIVETLRRDDWIVNPCQTACDLRWLLEEAPTPDLLIIDVNLCGEDALDVVQSFRDFKSSPPLIVVSGNVTDAIAQRARELGAVAVMEKPISVAMLRQHLNSLPVSDRPRQVILSDRQNSVGHADDNLSG